MLKKPNSRKKVRVAFESGLYAFILVLLFVGNIAILAVAASKHRMRTIPKMFATSLAIIDFIVGVLSTCPFGLTS